MVCVCVCVCVRLCLCVCMGVRVVVLVVLGYACVVDIDWLGVCVFSVGKRLRGDWVRGLVCMNV